MPEVRLIDAVALIQNHCGACANKEFCAEESCPYYEIRRRIETAPTIEAEPIRHGRWEKNESKQFYIYPYKCSVCKEINEYQFPYCPICGAKMQTEPPEEVQE